MKYLVSTTTRMPDRDPETGEIWMANYNMYLTSIIV